MYRLFHLTIIFFICFMFFALPRSAWAKSVDIIFASFPAVQQTFGIKIPSSLSDSLASEITNFFGSGIYLKITDPDTSLLSSSSFKNLTSRGFRWYFSFTNNNNVSSFLSAYFSQNSGEVVVELNCYPACDHALIRTLKNQYPNIKIHANGFMFWPRAEVKKVLEGSPPPTIEAVSIKTAERELNFDSFRLMFDTFYDAVFDVPAGSGVKINFPPNTKISLSEHKTNGSDSKSISFETSIISSAIVTAIQTEYRSNCAPAMYTIGSDFTQKSVNGKQITKYLSEFVKQKPTLVWPMAYLGNGGPYDSDTPYLRGSNPKPVVGMIGKVSNGYYIFLINTETEPVTANFEQNIGLNNYQFFSSSRGSGNFASGPNQITLNGHETIVAAPSLSQGQIVPTTPLQPTTSYPTSVLPSTISLPTNIPSRFPTQAGGFITQSPVWPTITQKQTTPPGSVIIPTNPPQPTPIPKTEVKFSIKINNPYTPHRKLEEAQFQLNDQKVALSQGENNFSLDLSPGTYKYKIEIKTNEGRSFSKKGNVNLQKENKIQVTLGNPLFVSLKNLSEGIFERIEWVNNLLKNIDQTINSLTSQNVLKLD